MDTTRAVAVPLAAVLLSACVTTTTTTRTWGESPGGEQGWARYGRVEQIRETVTQQRGDPAGGAMAGAFIGGILGSVLGGRSHHDRYGRVHTHASGAGAVVGAATGAMIGAAASQGAAEDRLYQVLVRYDDGGAEWYQYRGGVPFRVGDDVTLTPQGLVRG